MGPMHTFKASLSSLSLSSLTLISVVVIAIALLSSCQNTAPLKSPEKIFDTNNSLAKLDISGSGQSDKQVFIRPRSKQEIRKAYADYLKSADINDRSRLNALKRLAELDMDDTDEMLKKKEQLEQNRKDQINDRLYKERLKSTIKLLKTSLKDYPNARNNDELLYQLARAYDQKGESQKGESREAIEALTKLVDTYPKSQFYVESQFRIAEDAFSLQDYSTAEYSYTEVILSRNNEIFYSKSLFKRGWSRFKQHYYLQAVDDFLAAVQQHEFAAIEKLDKSEREQFDEYFRAISLAFSYQGDSKALYRYFKNLPDFKYTYHSYSRLSALYLKQQRYSDAVDIHQQFINQFPASDNIPYSHLKIIDIWEQSGFYNKVYEAVEPFYLQYNPSSSYWRNQNKNSNVNRAIRRALKKYVILMSAYHHNKYQQSNSPSDYKKTASWYERYLRHYSAYAQQDNIYFLYGELLTQINKNRLAFKYYELAAYDNDLIAHKDAAYATITLSNKLLIKDKKEYVHKHLDYAFKYAQKYSGEERAQVIMQHAAELAYHSEKYKTCIEFSDLLLAAKTANKHGYISGLKAASYFKLEEYSEAETIYSGLLKTGGFKNGQQKQVQDKLALAIYRQGEQALSNNDTAQAIHHYSRISSLAPDSDISATGLYDSIALNMQQKQWKTAIASSKHFQTLYPDHKLKSDISKKLSVAYLRSNQGLKAAWEFEKISNQSENINAQKSALWQAAELFQEKNKIDAAIRSYQDYSRKFKKPYSQYIEAMNILAELYTQQGSIKNADTWRNNIIKADEAVLNNVKTERTNTITSNAYLNLARHEKARFDKFKLTLPLKTSLSRKKTAMQRSVRLYARASQNKFYRISTEATYSIAEIYRKFSHELLVSDRPKNLSEEELDQYEILLEDQAFPFEDKAIEFFEINLSRIKDGLYNDWIKKSYRQLIDLFPVRYNRKPKLDDHVTEMY